MFGSYEAVVEAAMAVRRMDGMHGLTSDGVQAIADGPAGMHEFIGYVDGSDRGLSSVCSSLSKNYWTLVVGCSVLGIGFEDIAPDQCIWGAAAYADGAELLGGLTGSLESSLPADIRAQVDNTNSAGALPQSCLPELHQLAYSRARAEADAKLQLAIVAGSESHRWSPLTQAVLAQGLAGFGQILQASIVAGAPAIWGKWLTQEAVAARKDCAATWVDGLLCGTRTLGDFCVCNVQTEHAPLSDGDVLSWPARRAEILRALVQAPDSDHLANAILESLSSPRGTLQSGLHVLPYLIAADGPTAGMETVALAGLRRLINAVGVTSDEYHEDHKNQAVASVAKAGFSADSLRLAMRMGTSPGLLASKLLLSPGSTDGAKVLDASQLLDGLCALYGSILDFPKELSRAFSDSSSPVPAVFEARRTAALMGIVIQRASGTDEVAAVPAQAARRRRSV